MTKNEFMLLPVAQIYLNAEYFKYPISILNDLFLRVIVYFRAAFMLIV